jgi:hypothetical protein
VPNQEKCAVKRFAEIRGFVIFPENRGSTVRLKIRDFRIGYRCSRAIPCRMNAWVFAETLCTGRRVLHQPARIP